MIVRRPYNFRAIVGAYCLAGVVVAFLIHFIVLSSPRYNWIFPPATTNTAAGAAAPTTINPAPGAK